MKAENFNNIKHKSHVLIAPLEWGLGHTTRCIPIIFKLLEQNCEVTIAASGESKQLLMKEFPELYFIELKGYGIKYSRKNVGLPIKLFYQLPKIIFRIYFEHICLKKIIKHYSIDTIISDNRLGLFHKTVPCIYITHQLKIKTGNRATDWIVQKFHYWFINKYSECWVPDSQGDINLAGELSHPSRLPKVPVKYLGALSRFEKNGFEIKYDLIIIISGPEPQRTIFEKIILKEIENYHGRGLLIRGLPSTTSLIPFSSSFEMVNHLTSTELNRVIQQSKMIISRCGYTTIMDLVKLQQKAVLVPTPGQTEQEYLADYLMKQKIFYCEEQQGFSLKEALKKAEIFAYKQITFPLTCYETVIKDFLYKTSLSGKN